MVRRHLIPVTLAALLSPMRTGGTDPATRNLARACPGGAPSTPARGERVLGRREGRRCHALRRDRAPRRGGSRPPISRLSAGGLLSFLIPSADTRTYYVADEENGALLRVRLDGDQLTLVDQTPTTSHPVYLSMAERGHRRFLMTASYNEGIVESYELGAEGAIGRRAGAEKTGAHAHSVVMTPGPQEGTALVANEGADTITVLSVKEDGSLERLADVPSAAGPRHLAWRGNMVYVTHKRSVTLGWLRWNPAERKLTPVGVTPPPAAPTNAEEKVTAAHLVVQGAELFVTLRAGSASELLTFRLDAQPDGAPVLASRTPTLGATPRHFATLAPSDGAARLVVANQDGKSLALVGAGPTTAVMPLDVHPFFVLPVVADRHNSATTPPRFFLVAATGPPHQACTPRFTWRAELGAAEAARSRRSAARRRCRWQADAVPLQCVAQHRSGARPLGPGLSEGDLELRQEDRSRQVRLFPRACCDTVNRGGSYARWQDRLPPFSTAG